MITTRLTLLVLVFLLKATLTSTALFTGNYLMVNLQPDDKSSEDAIWMSSNLPAFEGSAKKTECDQGLTSKESQVFQSNANERIIFTSDSAAHGSIFAEESDSYFSRFTTDLD